MPDDRLAEPYDPVQRPVRWTVLAVAALVALLLSWHAPGPWSRGPGRVEVLLEEAVGAREIFRRGLPLDFIGLAVLVTAVLGVWRLLGVV